MVVKSTRGQNYLGRSLLHNIISLGASLGGTVGRVVTPDENSKTLIINAFVQTAKQKFRVGRPRKTGHLWFSRGTQAGSTDGRIRNRRVSENRIDCHFASEN